MSTKLSRRQLSTYVAKKLASGHNSVIDELAALLISENRVREADLLVRDIEDQLEELGELVVTVEAAKPIDEQTKQQVEQMFEGKTVHIREIVKPKLIGGLKISTPGQVLDATLLGKLTALRTMKV